MKKLRAGLKVIEPYHQRLLFLWEAGRPIQPLTILAPCLAELVALPAYGNGGRVEIKNPTHFQKTDLREATVELGSALQTIIEYSQGIGENHWSEFFQKVAGDIANFLSGCHELAGSPS